MRLVEKRSLSQRTKGDLTVTLYSYYSYQPIFQNRRKSLVTNDPYETGHLEWNRRMETVDLSICAMSMQLYMYAHSSFSPRGCNVLLFIPEVAVDIEQSATATHQVYIRM